MKGKVCVIIGASHAGINCAFHLRKEGWAGEIIIFDKDKHMPYHRPPLSKAYLTSNDGIGSNLLMPEESYKKEDISLKLGMSVVSISRQKKLIQLDDGSEQAYDKLVLATGARALIPNIPGIEDARNIFTLRNADDVGRIREALGRSATRRVTIIGGGYIGLETAASLTKLDAKVTVLEREERILARVTTKQMSEYFHKLHHNNGVAIHTGKNVISLIVHKETTTIVCSDNSSFESDIVLIGVGIQVNTELAASAGLEINNGIRVDARMQTSDPDIYAIGDCTNHYNERYGYFVRLESVQNAVDQSKAAAVSICGLQSSYEAIAWFWSDQYHIKLQIVGLSKGFTEVLVRKEHGKTDSFSYWYFKGEELLAVDAINNAKAYVIGTKFIKDRIKVDKGKLVDPNEEFRLANLQLA